MATRKKSSDDQLPLDAGDYAQIQVKVYRIWQNDAGDIERVTVIMPNGNRETFSYDPEWIQKVATGQVFRTS